MPDRNGNSGNYRYAFNGQENDNEIKGNGNSVDFGARIYDARLGRWQSKDPVYENYPDLSPYNSMENNPIYNVDYKGKWAEISIKRYYKVNDQLKVKKWYNIFKETVHKEVVIVLHDVKFYAHPNTMVTYWDKEYDENNEWIGWTEVQKRVYELPSEMLNLAVSMLQKELVTLFNPKQPVMDKNGKSANITLSFANDIEVVPTLEKKHVKPLRVIKPDHLFAIVDDIFDWVGEENVGKGVAVTINPRIHLLHYPGGYLGDAMNSILSSSNTQMRDDASHEFLHGLTGIVNCTGSNGLFQNGGKISTGNIYAIKRHRFSLNAAGGGYSNRNDKGGGYFGLRKSSKKWYNPKLRTSND